MKVRDFAGTVIRTRSRGFLSCWAWSPGYKPTTITSVNNGSVSSFFLRKGDRPVASTSRYPSPWCLIFILHSLRPLRLNGFLSSDLGRDESRPYVVTLAPFVVAPFSEAKSLDSSSPLDSRRILP